MAKRTFKKGKVLSGAPMIYRKWNEWEEGDYIIGQYMGTKHDAKYNKDNFIFKVEDASMADRKFAKSILGQQLQLNTCGKLAAGLKDATEGEFFQVEYEGLKEMEGGNYAGKDAHQVIVTEMLSDSEDDDEESEEEEYDL